MNLLVTYEPNHFLNYNSGMCTYHFLLEKLRKESHTYTYVVRVYGNLQNIYATLFLSCNPTLNFKMHTQKLSKLILDF